MAFDLGSIDWGSVLNTAGSLYGAYQSSQAANTQQDAAAQAARATQIQPYSGASPVGQTLFNPANRSFVLNPTTNPFSQLFTSLGTASLANAGSANGMPFNGANPGVVQAMNDANAAYAPNSADAQGVLAQLRAVAQPQENRDRVSLDNQNFATGNFGTTGGNERLRAMLEAQGQTDLQRQVAATGISTQNANQRFANAMSTVNQGMSGQQSQFNMGVNANAQNQNLFSQLLQQAGISLGAGGGQAPNAAIYSAANAGNTQLANAQMASNPVWGQLLNSVLNRPNTASPAAASTPNSLAGNNDYMSQWGSSLNLPVG